MTSWSFHILINLVILDLAILMVRFIFSSEPPFFDKNLSKYIMLYLRSISGMKLNVRNNVFVLSIANNKILKSQFLHNNVIKPDEYMAQSLETQPSLETKFVIKHFNRNAFGKIKSRRSVHIFHRDLTFTPLVRKIAIFYKSPHLSS